MGNVTVRFFDESSLEAAADLILSAWEYYLQEAEPSRVKALLEENLDHPAWKVLIAFENELPVGVAEFSITESYRCDGEEARLELLFIRDTAGNYYDVHAALMNGIFEFLRKEKIEFLRIDTTLENADVMVV
ncbi:MAG: hypothetical protein LWY06_16085 [Firmicutes bacterium]|nr:hypothetical protein [Bacillota bacterium]